jgi:hypothetical protein
VTDNGRITFDAGSAAWVPSVSAAMSVPGFFGVWCDLTNVDLGISVVSPASGVLSLQFSNVRYYATSNYNTFQLTLDTNDQSLQISGMQGIHTNSVSSSINQFIGVSKGYGATNPGQTSFSSFIGSGMQLGPGGFGMTYRFGPEGTLTPNVNSIVFTPNGAGNYNFTVN